MTYDKKLEVKWNKRRVTQRVGWRGKMVQTRDGVVGVHRFKSNVKEIAVIQGRLYALTENGAYRADRNFKRWRRWEGRWKC